MSKEMDDRDEILEQAALICEEESLLDLRGILSKTKKGQREYEIRQKAINETRATCADLIRAMKSGRGRDPLVQLRRIAECDPRQHSLYLVDAWPLAWKGWLNIECKIQCNSNCSPPSTEYVLTLTETGREMLTHGQSTGEK